MSRYNTKRNMRNNIKNKSIDCQYIHVHKEVVKSMTYNTQTNY